MSSPIFKIAISHGVSVALMAGVPAFLVSRGVGVAGADISWVGLKMFFVGASFSFFIFGVGGVIRPWALLCAQFMRKGSFRNSEIDGVIEEIIFFVGEILLSLVFFIVLIYFFRHDIFFMIDAWRIQK